MSYALLSDCRDVMAALRKRGHTVQSIVTDPPYGITFMGKPWDAPADNIVFTPAVWKLCFDLLLPGGYLVAFGAPRTYHRMVGAIEDAGFEIRDQLAWVYGSGFPKSLDVSKAIDKKLGYEREVIGMQSCAATAVGTFGNYDVGDRVQIPITAPASPEAQAWDGWGTNLKPAMEPIVLARRPLRGAVAANVLEQGVGALNIGECRVAAPMDGVWGSSNATIALDDGSRMFNASPGARDYRTAPHPAGRWPANFLHDGSDEVLEAFAQFGEKVGSPASPFLRRKSLGYESGVNFKSHKDEFAGVGYGDTGSAARFFYCAKAGKKERNGSKHPTIKPVALMRWLVRLITPRNGIVLDPFAGTGTTGEAARLEGRDYILIERDPMYFDDIKNRLSSNK
jgi:DNA modification methylase